MIKDIVDNNLENNHFVNPLDITRISNISREMSTL